MNALAARRRHPAALFVLLLLALVAMGSAYALAAPKSATAAADTSGQVAKGQQLFAANCATCHGAGAQGRDHAPSLAGAGAAAVDFQMGTGRMPAQMPGPQVRPNHPGFAQADIDAIGAYVASLAPGPAVPAAADLDTRDADAARGGEIFRVNCAMCHNANATGGALTRGKFAPTLRGVTPAHIYEAMLTGPQSMPKFSDTNLDPKAKRDVLAYLAQLDEEKQPGGFAMNGIGPVPEGLLAWTLGIGLCVGAAVWLGKKAA